MSHRGTEQSRVLLDSITTTLGIAVDLVELTCSLPLVRNMVPKISLVYLQSPVLHTLRNNVVKIPETPYGVKQYEVKGVLELSEIDAPHQVGTKVWILLLDVWPWYIVCYEFKYTVKLPHKTFSKASIIWKDCSKVKSKNPNHGVHDIRLSSQKLLLSGRNDEMFLILLYFGTIARAILRCDWLGDWLCQKSSVSIALFQ